MVQETTSAVVDVLSRSSLFASSDAESLRDIASAFQLVTVSAGAILCAEGEPGDAMYVVEDGRFSVDTEIAGKPLHLALLGPGGVIGEMAVITGEPRSATVRATTDARVWSLSREDFQRLLPARPEIGIAVARLTSERARHLAGVRPAQEKDTLAALEPGKDVVTIGRDAGNDIVIDDPQVSRVHALIERLGDRYNLVDLSGGNTRLNGERVDRATVRDADEIWIGTHKIYFDRSALTAFTRGAGVQVDAYELTTVVDKRTTILDGVSLSVYPGEFVCIVGGSGAGKSTLLNALNGSMPASRGQVRYNGVDYYRHYDVYRSALGYVPQDDIVHSELTVAQTLYYAARLRLPRDSARPEIEARITEVLETLELTEVSLQEVRHLSGGQRKRVSIGVELLTQPGIFFLDEPTSGLDPALEGRMMTLLRKLANGGRTVIMTTHATKNVMLSDKIIFMTSGGRLAFYGGPSEALEHFGVADFIDIYTRLEFEDDPETWRDRYLQSPYQTRNVQQRLEASVPSEPSSAKGQRRALPGVAEAIWQFRWLTLRHINILRHDPTLLALLLIQAPIIALVLALTFPHNVFALTESQGGDAREAIALLFNLAVASVYLGADGASRAITEERAIYTRERLINLRILPYVFSKIGVFGVFSLLQSLLLAGVTAAVIAIPGGNNSFAELYLVLAVTNLVGVGLGLLISSLSGNSLQAGATVILMIIPQLILAGAFVPLSRISGFANVLADLMISRWSLSLLGYFTNLNARLDAQLVPGTTNYYAQQFDINAPLYTAILALFFLVFITGTVVVLKRKDAR